jgi:hypothetical protein
MPNVREHLTVAVRAKPGARVAQVGGSWGERGELLVAVPERAIDGAANAAVVTAVAGAFGVSRSAVSLVRGARGRSKLLAVAGDREQLQARLAQLLAQ